MTTLSSPSSLSAANLSPYPSRRGSLVTTAIESASSTSRQNFLTPPELDARLLAVDGASRASSASSAAASSSVRHRVVRRRKARHRNQHRSNNNASGSDLPLVTPGERLRKIIKCILMIVEVCMELKRYVNEKAKKKKENLSLVEMQLKLEADMNKKLPFNPHLYKASYVVNKGSSKLKQLLAIAPEARTKKHVKSIHSLVRNKAAFSKHPIHIRMKLCHVMIYQSYEPRRVIIKQGHPPTAFYIILSGTCLINLKTTDEDGEEKVITINEIKEGEVFGEVALLNNTVRTASVVCKDEVELLVIYQQDFDKTVRGPIYKQREEVIDFCRSLHIFRDWPVEVLQKASYASFQYQYFRKGTIVVKNGLDCNFVVFIKSGECRLISILDADDGNDWEKNFLSTLQRAQQEPQPPSRKTYAGRSGLGPIPEIRKRESGIKYANIIETPPSSHRASRLVTPRISQTRPSIFARKNSMFPGGAKIAYGRRASNLQNISEIQVMRKPKRVSLDKMQENDPSPAARYLRNTAPRPSIIQDTPYAVPKAFISKYMKKSPHHGTLPAPTFSNQSASKHNGHQQQEGEKPKPKFAQIAYLKEGSSFGLEELMKRTNLRLTLMSEGSEIVFVSRKLLLRHANGETMRNINSLIGRYPTEEYIRAQLAQHGDWSRFRESVVQDVLGRKTGKSADHSGGGGLANIAL